MSHSVVDRSDLSSFHHWCSLFDFLSDDNLSIVEFCVQQLTKLLFKNSIKNYPWTHDSLSLSTMMQKILYMECCLKSLFKITQISRNKFFFFSGTKIRQSLLFMYLVCSFMCSFNMQILKNVDSDSSAKS